MVRMIDELKALRRENGWESDFYKSDAWHQAKATWGALFLEGKDMYGLGVIAGPDEKLMERVIGDDPTAIRDFTATLDTTRRHLENKIRDKMRSAGARPEDLRRPVFVRYGSGGKELKSDKEAKNVIMRGYIPGVGPTPMTDRVSDLRAKFDEYALDDPDKAEKFIRESQAMVQADTAEHLGRISALERKKKLTPAEEKEIEDRRTAIKANEALFTAAGFKRGMAKRRTDSHKKQEAVREATRRHNAAINAFEEFDDAVRRPAKRGQEGDE